MKKYFPIISVVIATFDSERTIEKCLTSIKKQTYPNIDIVVVDSFYYEKEKQLRCRKIIKKYARYFQDGPERSIQRNIGIKKAKGEYILVIDQDMYLTPQVAQECYEKISKYSALTIPELSIGEGYWAECVALERYVSIYLEKGLNECCRFFRKKDALDIGGYDASVVGVEDADFHSKMRTKGQIGKIKSHIDHDEGRIHFLNHVKKMYYYSKSSKSYLQRYSVHALIQFFPIKRAYFKHWRVLAKNPHITFGMFLLKGADTVTLIFGLVRGFLRG